MKREEVIHILSGRRTELAQKYGVKSLFLFGSASRDETGSASDVDLLVEFDRPVGYFGLFALQDHLESLLGCRVDLGTPKSLRPRIRARVMGESARVSPGEWKDRLRDILDAVAEIQAFTRDMDFEAFSADAKTQKAVECNLIVIGEAANQIPDNVLENHP